MKRIDKETEEKVIKTYNSGLSMAVTGKQYNISGATVKHILERNNVPVRTKGGIYKIPEEDVITRYKNNESCQSIADSYNVSFNTISNILEKNNIPRDNRYYNLNLDLNYFSKIDRYDKAYFLGFLITDGNVCGNAVRLSLATKDEHILYCFKEKTGNENKIYYRKDKPEASCSAKVKQWVEDLAHYGVIPNKTSQVYLPQLSKEMMPHLLRGMIDGDGWISSKSHQIGFCGNEQTVTQVRDYFIKELNVYPVKVLHTNTTLWQITWASQKDIELIGNYLYKNKKDCFLKRKFNEFQKIQGNTEVT